MGPENPPGRSGLNTADLDKVCQELVSLLEGQCGDWEGTQQLQGTASRLGRMYNEFCWTKEKIESELSYHFKALYPHTFNEMLVNGPITVWTLCPHHLLPCEFKVVIGYVPEGQVLGLSKFARISEVLARRPVMQEQYSSDLAGSLQNNLKPKGIAVYVTGTHGCMVCRGVKQSSKVVTSVIRGCFEEATTRAEFFAIARDRV